MGRDPAVDKIAAPRFAADQIKQCSPVALRSLGACLLAFCCGPALHAAELQLRILETTDVHMNLLSCDY